MNKYLYANMKTGETVHTVQFQSDMFTYKLISMDTSTLTPVDITAIELIIEKAFKEYILGETMLLYHTYLLNIHPKFPTLPKDLSVCYEKTKNGIR